MSELRERVGMLVDRAAASGRHLVAVWRIEPNPVPGKNDTMVLDELEMHRWPMDDFLLTVDMLKRRLAEVASNPAFRDPEPVVDVQADLELPLPRGTRPPEMSSVEMAAHTFGIYAA